MSRAGLRGIATLFIASAIVATGLAGPPAALAVTKGRNGWYWPTGTDDVGDHSGWLDYRSSNHSWHLAKDIGAARGRPVYAAADGVVYDMNSELDGYGPGGGHGGAIVVMYRERGGGYFKALYGHVYGIKYKKGARVKAGAVLAYLNGVSPPHCHFGVHPGKALPTDPQHNVFRGHTYAKGRFYGWVDPIAYLDSHTPWVAPAQLTAPSAPATVAVGSTFSTSGQIGPKHPAGPSDVTVEMWLYTPSGWKYVRSLSASLADDGEKSSYSADVTPSMPGTWRLVARAPEDASHLAGSSPSTLLKAVP
jgi:murein DD-endopeptidase MepM/ murein hydrolase activator NlpD